MNWSVPKLRFSELKNASTFSEIAEQIREAGALLITDIDELAPVRNNVLASIREFAFIPEEKKEKYISPESNYSVGWSRGKERLEGDSPDTCKGSLYFNMSRSERSSSNHSSSPLETGYHVHCMKNIWPTDEVPSLESNVLKLADLMTRVGLVLIRALDDFLTSRVNGFTAGSLPEIFQSSMTHKGRALVYYPIDVSESTEKWCGEHFDHGIITALIAPTYFNESNNVVSVVDENCGLFIRNSVGQVQRVTCPENCLLFQFGECAEILSGGELKATSHYVKPPQITGIYRATLAVFFNPNIDVTLRTPNDVTSEVHQFRNGETFGQFSSERYTRYY